MMVGIGLALLLLTGGALAAVLVGAAWLASRKGTGLRGPIGPHQQTAHKVLDERFARGEISAEEYETVRSQIEN
jgi:uncharacterized membrane protein